MAQWDKIHSVHGKTSAAARASAAREQLQGVWFYEMGRDGEHWEISCQAEFWEGKKTNICFGLVKASLLILLLKRCDVLKALK